MEALPKQNEIFHKLNRAISLKVVPVLNPDGAVAYTRCNANGVDLNRDALDLSQPESRLLQRLGRAFQPDFAFNMHDQDPIYGIGKTNKAAILSFLAPGVDDRGTMTPSRKRAVQTIAGIVATMEEEIPGHIGRYKDEFNPNCMGEYFQIKGASTILFESGHIKQDYAGDTVRKYVFNAFLTTLENIADKRYERWSIADYLAIPRNAETFYDVLIREVKYLGKITDVAFRYRAQVEEHQIQWRPEVSAIGNLNAYFGHWEIQGKGRIINGIPKKELEKGDIMNEITLNNEELSIRLTNN